MYERNRRTVRTLLLPAIVLVPAGILAVLSASQPAGATMPGELAPKKYKNIKVLKQLPADQLIPVMHKINDSLGVRCDYCHVVTTDAAGNHVGWEKDDKKMKGVARGMMVMTQDLYLHQKITGGKVTCFTCHHGRAEPENSPPAQAPPVRR